MPTSTDPTPNRPDHADDQPATRDSKQLHILVINDTQEILDLFKDILEGEGYRVTLSSYAFQDVREVEQINPDLVILDLLFHDDKQGWQLLQKLRMYQPTATVPVIVCTAALNLVRELEGHLRAKDVYVLLKPFDIDELLEVVQIAAQPRRSVRGR